MTSSYSTSYRSDAAVVSVPPSVRNQLQQPGSTSKPLEDDESYPQSAAPLPNKPHSPKQIGNMTFNKGREDGTPSRVLTQEPRDTLVVPFRDGRSGMLPERRTQTADLKYRPAKRQKKRKGNEKFEAQRKYRKNRNKYKVKAKKRYKKLKNKKWFKKQQKIRRQNPQRFKRKTGSSVFPISVGLIFPGGKLVAVKLVSFDLDRLEFLVELTPTKFINLSWDKVLNLSVPFDLADYSRLLAVVDDVLGVDDSVATNSKLAAFIFLDKKVNPMRDPHRWLYNKKELQGDGIESHSVFKTDSKAIGHDIYPYHEDH